MENKKLDEYNDYIKYRIIAVIYHYLIICTKKKLKLQCLTKEQ